MSADDEGRKLVVSDLPSELSRCDEVTVFFESERYCPDGGDVDHVDMAADRRSAVVTFTDKSGTATESLSSLPVTLSLLVAAELSSCVNDNNSSNLLR